MNNSPPNEPLSFEQWWKEITHGSGVTKEDKLMAHITWCKRDIEISSLKSEITKLKSDMDTIKSVDVLVINGLKSEILAKDNEIKALKAHLERLKGVSNVVRSLYDERDELTEAIGILKEQDPKKFRELIEQKSRREVSLMRSTCESRLELSDRALVQAREEIVSKDKVIDSLKDELDVTQSICKNEKQLKLSYKHECESLKSSLATALERAQKAEEKAREIRKVLNFIKINGRPHGRPVWEVEIDPMIEKALSASDPSPSVDDVKDSNIPIGKDAKSNGTKFAIPGLDPKPKDPDSEAWFLTKIFTQNAELHDLRAKLKEALSEIKKLPDVILSAGWNHHLDTINAKVHSERLAEIVSRHIKQALAAIDKDEK